MSSFCASPSPSSSWVGQLGQTGHRPLLSVFQTYFSLSGCNNINDGLYQWTAKVKSDWVIINHGIVNPCLGYWVIKLLSSILNILSTLPKMACRSPNPGKVNQFFSLFQSHQSDQVGQCVIGCVQSIIIITNKKGGGTNFPFTCVTKSQSQLGQFFCYTNHFWFFTSKTDHTFLPFFSAKCSHPKADYAWSSVAETVSLGPEAANGILLICRSGGLKSSIKRTKVESCVAEFDTSSFMVHLAPTGSSLESTCQKVLSNVMHLLETGKIQETKKLRFIIGFGNRIWYGNDCK